MSEQLMTRRVYETDVKYRRAFVRPYTKLQDERQKARSERSPESINATVKCMVTIGK